MPVAGIGIGAVRYGAAMDIDERLQDYAEDVSSPHEPWLAALSEETSTARSGPGQMLTGPVAGRFLELLVWGTRPQRVLEIGTFSGHATLSMAAGLAHRTRTSTPSSSIPSAQPWLSPTSTAAPGPGRSPFTSAGG